MMSNMYFSIKEGTIEAFYSANSKANYFKLLKGESSTKHDIFMSSMQYNKAVAAPILLPHSPIKLTFPEFLRYSTEI